MNPAPPKANRLLSFPVQQQCKQRQKFRGIKDNLTKSDSKEGVKFLNFKEEDEEMDNMTRFIVGTLYCLVCSLNSCYFITSNTEKCPKGLCSLTKNCRGAADPSRNGFCLQVAFSPENALCTTSECKMFCLTQYIWTQINNWPSARLKTKSEIHKHGSKSTKKKDQQILRREVHKRKTDKLFTLWALPKNCATALELA